MLRVTRYSPADSGLWNAFVAEAKNGVFLFDRRYMDYHADRFVDHSLLVWRDDELVALLPANERDGALVSHGGLTFGGVVSNRRMRTPLMLEVFEAICQHARGAGLARILYKVLPHIYHQAPSEEDLYALFRFEGRLYRRDVSSAINLAAARLPFTKGRKWGASRALKNGLTVSESLDIEGFMVLEEAHLRKKFGVSATHSGAEMRLLADRFPRNIRLFTAEQGGRVAGGVLLYLSPRVAHAQYICATDEGLEYGSLDAIMKHLLEAADLGGAVWFDFGISTEDAGRRLNLGLVDNKESYGARAIVHDFYEIAL